MMTFRLIVTLVTVAIHLPFAAAVAELGRRLDWPAPPAIGLALAVLGILLFTGRMPGSSSDKHREGQISVWLVDIPYFIHWCACLFTLVPAVLATLLAPIVDLATGESPHLPMATYLFTYALGLVVCGYGILVRRRWFHVREVDVAIHGLDPSFDGFRIAHLSDLHIGSYTPKSWGLRWARAANAETPDIAVVTGDMVTSGTAYHEDIATVMAELAAKDGVYVSMGNHDYFGEGEPLITRMRERGVSVLRNEGVVLERGGKKLFLAAIDDTWTERDDLDRALAGRPEGSQVVLLAHDPERFRVAAKRDVALTLSGHTHGGQIAMPFFSRWISLSHLTHHFHQGLYRIGRSTLYVHPGLGTTGPPMRLGVAPIVAILRLRAA
jgi:predicted MPP superfamily phosphohydrolase